MTSWRTLPTPPVPVGKRPKDEAVPRLARCCELVERLEALRRAYARYDRLKVWLLRIAAAGLVVTVLLTLDLLRSLP